MVVPILWLLKKAALTIVEGRYQLGRLGLPRSSESTTLLCASDTISNVGARTQTNEQIQGVPGQEGRLFGFSARSHARTPCLQHIFVPQVPRFFRMKRLQNLRHVDTLLARECYNFVPVPVSMDLIGRRSVTRHVGH